MPLRAKLEANEEIDKDVLGKSCQTEDFQRRWDIEAYPATKAQKQKARKGINVDKSPQGDSETDEEESVEAMNPTPLDTKSNIVANWKIFQQVSLVMISRVADRSQEPVYTGKSSCCSSRIIPKIMLDTKSSGCQLKDTQRNLKSQVKIELGEDC
ncbi:hypothetical protein Tco_0790048 [Tanacetum coccineum]